MHQSSPALAVRWVKFWACKLKSPQIAGRVRKICVLGNNGSCLKYGISVNQPIAHAELIASYKKVAADAAKKAALVLASASKGPGVIKSVSETAAKAGRRRDVIASKLAKLGVALPE